VRLFPVTWQLWLPHRYNFMHSLVKPLLVIAENGRDQREMLRLRFLKWGYDVACVGDRQALLAQMAESPADVVLLDSRLDNEDGLDICSELAQHPSSPAVLVLASGGTIASAVQAMRLGVFDYLPKSTSLEHLRRVVAKAVGHRRLRRRVDQWAPGSDGCCSAEQLVGDSLAMKHLHRMIRQVGGTDATVLIQGETGTGKELVARAIHDFSPRSGRPFVPVNMAALPRDLAESLLFGHEKGAFSGAETARDGWCQSANRGTLLLDEIGDMDLALQAKLLRFLQDRAFHPVGANQARKVDVRILASTNGDTRRLVQEGRFREDLYHRLNVFPIVVPPLRNRREDIPLLAAWFLQRQTGHRQPRCQGFTDGALHSLQRYDWPGNVRELENLVERLAILWHAPLIGAELLPEHIRTAKPAALDLSPAAKMSGDDADDLRVIDRIEKRAILEALATAKGNVAAAARVLGIGQATLYRKIKRYAINPKRWRDEAGRLQRCPTL